MAKNIVLLILGSALAFGYAQTYDRCELARELIRMGSSRDQVSTWVCIAQHESNFDMSAIGPPNTDGSRDHGIFQINDRYWCSPPGRGCNIDCATLRQSLSASWRCAQTVYDETRRMRGNGFSAWSVYPRYCTGDTSHYVEGCFGDQGGRRMNLLQNYLVLPMYAAATCWNQKD